MACQFKNYFLQYQNYFLHSKSNAMVHYKILKKRPPENTKLFPKISKLFPTLKIKCYGALLNLKKKSGKRQGLINV